jgi:hypothetical protein
MDTLFYSDNFTNFFYGIANLSYEFIPGELQELSNFPNFIEAANYQVSESYLCNRYPDIESNIIHLALTNGIDLSVLNMGDINFLVNKITGFSRLEDLSPKDLRMGYPLLSLVLRAIKSVSLDFKVSQVLERYVNLE